MTAMRIMTTVRDLRNWVDSHIEDSITEAELGAIVEAIRSDPDCPHWGDDWRDYLDGLGNLWELIDDPAAAAEFAGPEGEARWQAIRREMDAAPRGECEPLGEDVPL